MGFHDIEKKLKKQFTFKKKCYNKSSEIGKKEMKKLLTNTNINTMGNEANAEGGSS